MNSPTHSVPLIAPQRWKFQLWAVALCVLLVGMFAPDAVARLAGTGRAEISLAATAFGFLALVGFTLSIRCPSCSLSLAWYALSKQSHGAWLTWLLEVKVCPRCGYSHSSVSGVDNAE